MLTKQEQVFLEITKKRNSGIYLPLEVLNGENQRLYNLANRTFIDLRTGILLFENGLGLPRSSIFIGLVDSEKVGAFAEEVNGDSYIGIHKGTFLILDKLFQLFLSFSDTRQEIGDSSSEKNPCGLIKKIPANLSDFPIEFTYKAENRHRELYGYLLYSLSILCICFHEVSHIKRGHLKIKAILKEELAFGQINQEEYKLNIQALEFDADLSSVYLITSWLENIHRNQVPIAPPFDIYLSNLSNSLEMLIVSAKISSYLSYEDKAWAFHLGSYDHPPPPYRSVSIESIIPIVLKDYPNEILGILNKSSDIELEVKGFFEKLMGSKEMHQPTDQFRALSSIFESYNSRLLDKRRELMDKYVELCSFPDPLGESESHA